MAKIKSAAPADNAFGYLKLGKDHGYLGHFRAPKFIHEGHNTTLTPRQTSIVEPAGGFQTPTAVATTAPGLQTPPTAVATSAPGFQTPPTATTSTMAPGLQAPATPRPTFLQEHPVIAARRGSRGIVRESRQALRQAARTGVGGAEARANLQSAIAGRRAAVSAARSDPNSAFMEANARREKRLRAQFERFSARAGVNPTL